jgi:AcrR family transcriptional regulator
MTAAAGSEPGTRRERRKREVHERLLEAAERLFRRQGFDATTIDEIAELAGVAQKTFFNHFATKQALIGELAEAVIARFREELAEIRRAPVSTRERLARCFRHLADEVEASRHLARDLILASIRLLPEQGRTAAGLPAAFGAILADGRAAGEVRRDLPLEFLAEMTVGALGAVLTNWASARDYPLQRRLAQTASFVADAVAPR